MGKTPLPPITAAALLLLALPSVAGAETQSRPDYLDQPARIVKVGTFANNKTYPLVVFLPFTTGSASRFYEQAKGPQAAKTYVALIPAGTVQQTDYLPDFAAYVGWYEKKLLLDIETAKKNHPVDPGRIYLQGYSLGGDLAWALMVRQKELFAGAIVIGSRCSWPLGADTLESWKSKGRRIAFLIGEQDNADRAAGMKAAADRTAAAGVKTRFDSYQGAHSIPAAEDLAKACRFLSGSGE